MKPGGGLVYATCSVLPAENERQIEAFLERHPEFVAVPVADVWRDAMGAEAPAEIATGPYLRLSPLRHGTDGFFAATLLRKPDEPKAKPAEEPGEPAQSTEPPEATEPLQSIEPGEATEPAP